MKFIIIMLYRHIYCTYSLILQTVLENLKKNVVVKIA